MARHQGLRRIRRGKRSPFAVVGHTGRRTGAAYATQAIVRTDMAVNQAFALIERAMSELEEDR